MSDTGLTNMPQSQTDEKDEEHYQDMMLPIGPPLWKPQGFFTFIVDKDEVKQEFFVHKSVATFHSPFFRAAFEGKFLEGQTQTMRLEDVEALPFGLLLQWLYTQDIGPELDPSPPEPKDVILFAKVWILADRWLIRGLQNTLVHGIIFHLERNPMGCLPDFIRYVYEETESSELRKVAIYTANGILTEESFAELSKEFSPDMWVDVIKDLKEFACRNSARYQESYPLNSFEVAEVH